MALRELAFSPVSAIEALLYILDGRGGSTTVHDLLKVRYAADKVHLAQYGWIASGDRYCAMNFGPVASSTYDLLKVAGRKRNYAPPRFTELAVAALDASAYPHVRAKRKPDVSRLSSAEVAALDQALNSTPKDFGKRTEQSHDAAWQTARQRWSDNGDMEMPVGSIAGTLDNAREVLAYIDA